MSSGEYWHSANCLTMQHVQVALLESSFSGSGARQQAKQQRHALAAQQQQQQQTG